MLRRFSLASATLLVIAAAPSSGQNTLRDKFIALFTFGDCGAALCLGGVSQLIGHGNHFVPAAAASGQSALDFVTNAIATNVTNVPVPSTGGGAVFEFVDGLPVRTDLSAGPIFAERASTLGRGRFLMGVNATVINLRSVRGVPMDNLLFRFGHEDVPPTGVGNPGFENDIIEVQANLDVSVYVATAYASFGVLDAVDIGFAVPFINVSMSGNAVAEIRPFGSGASSLHLFEGTSVDPVLVAVSSADGSASGIGDISGRLKIRVSQSSTVGVGLIGEVRLPTGNEDNLLGSGELAVRALGIFSARFGDFTPHVNAGYSYQRSDLQTDAVLATIGFDQLLGPKATMAVDLVTQWQVGESSIGLGEPIVYTEPFARSIPSTLIPDRRDDILNGSLGFKLNPSERLRIITNVLVPLGSGGVQSSATFTLGFELTL